MPFVVTNVEGVILRDIANKKMKREDIALTYCLCIQSSESVDWHTVNAAVLARWSESGLIWIKRRAWKLKRLYAEGKQP